MGGFPLITIVTPSFNQAAYIGETIESVLSQAGEFEIEYFIMDGGSTDGSVEIIKSYAEHLSCGEYPLRCMGATLEWVSHKDKGQSDAINQGLRRATGEIAGYINSDDAFCDGAFARVLQEFAARPEADFIYGDGDVIGAEGELQWEWLSRPYDHGVMTSYHFWWNDFTNYIMQQATFWRRSVMERIGYFDENFHYAMDTEYWIRAGHHGLHLHHLPHKLGKFRLITGTKSLSSPTVFWKDYLEIFRRYRGARQLGRFFAYFYYNVAKQLGWNCEQARQTGRRVFEQWQHLPEREQNLIEHQADYGYGLACLLVATELLRLGQQPQAQRILTHALSQRHWLAAHPLSWNYGFRRLAGQRVSVVLDAWATRFIQYYRRTRYEARYHTQPPKS